MTISTTQNIYLVTTCRNAEATIEETFTSIAMQVNTYGEKKGYEFHLRYHVQDSCSTDETLCIIKKWEKKFQEIPWCTFSYKTEPDRNMYDGVSKGFEAIGSMNPESYMGWLNADDIFFPECLQTVANVSHAFPEISWIGGRVHVIDASGVTILSSSQFYPREFIARGFCNGVIWSFLQQEGSFFKKKLWDASEGLSKEYRLIGDWDLWQRMATLTPYITIDIFMGSFRKREGQLSSQGYLNEIYEHTSTKVIYTRFLELLFKTKGFNTLPPTEHITVKNNVYNLTQVPKPTIFYIIRTFLICNHMTFLVKWYDTLKNLIAKS